MDRWPSLRNCDVGVRTHLAPERNDITTQVPYSKQQPHSKHYYGRAGFERKPPMDR